jgi:hypothetical protein
MQIVLHGYSGIKINLKQPESEAAGWIHVAEDEVEWMDFCKHLNRGKCNKLSDYELLKMVFAKWK